MLLLPFAATQSLKLAVHLFLFVLFECSIRTKAEEALRSQIKKTPDAKAGYAVVSDAKTGAILTIAATQSLKLAVHLFLFVLFECSIRTFYYSI
jgi:hypothetical protein